MSDSDVTAALEISSDDESVRNGANNTKGVMSLHDTTVAEEGRAPWVLSPFSDVEIPAVSVWVTTAPRRVAAPQREAATPGGTPSGAPTTKRKRIRRELANLRFPGHPGMPAIALQEDDQAALRRANRATRAMADDAVRPLADGVEGPADLPRRSFQISSWLAYCAYIKQTRWTEYEAFKAHEAATGNRRNGALPRFCKAYRQENMDEWAAFMSRYKSGAEVNDVGSSAVAVPPDAVVTVAKECSGHDSTVGKKLRRFSAARRAAASSVQDRDSLQLLLEGGIIDFESLVWPTPLQPRINASMGVVVDVEVVSFVRGTLYYTPWLDLSINPKLLAMPLISILLNCMRPLGPDSDVLLLRINDAKRIHEICDAYQKGCDAEAKRKQYESTLPTIALLVKDCAIHSGVPKKGVVLTMEHSVHRTWEQLMPDILDVGVFLVRSCTPTERPLWDDVSAWVKKPKDLAREGKWTTRSCPLFFFAEGTLGWLRCTWAELGPVVALRLLSLLVPQAYPAPGGSREALRAAGRVSCTNVPPPRIHPDPPRAGHELVPGCLVDPDRWSDIHIAGTAAGDGSAQGDDDADSRARVTAPTNVKRRRRTLKRNWKLKTLTAPAAAASPDTDTDTDSEVRSSPPQGRVLSSGSSDESSVLEVREVPLRRGADALHRQPRKSTGRLFVRSIRTAAELQRGPRRKALAQVSETPDAGIAVEASSESTVSTDGTDTLLDPSKIYGRPVVLDTQGSAAAVAEQTMSPVAPLPAARHSSAFPSLPHGVPRPPAILAHAWQMAVAAHGAPASAPVPPPAPSLPEAIVGSEPPPVPPAPPLPPGPPPAFRQSSISPIHLAKSPAFRRRIGRGFADYLQGALETADAAPSTALDVERRPPSAPADGTAATVARYSQRLAEFFVGQSETYDWAAGVTQEAFETAAVAANCDPGVSMVVFTGYLRRFARAASDPKAIPAALATLDRELRAFLLPRAQQRDAVKIVGRREEPAAVVGRRHGGVPVGGGQADGRSWRRDSDTNAAHSRRDERSGEGRGVADPRFLEPDHVPARGPVILRTVSDEAVRLDANPLLQGRSVDPRRRIAASACPSFPTGPADQSAANRGGGAIPVLRIGSDVPIGAPLVVSDRSANENVLTATIVSESAPPRTIQSDGAAAAHPPLSSIAVALSAKVPAPPQAAPPSSGMLSFAPPKVDDDDEDETPLGVEIARARLVLEAAQLGESKVRERLSRARGAELRLGGLLHVELNAHVNKVVEAQLRFNELCELREAAALGQGRDAASVADEGGEAVTTAAASRPEGRETALVPPAVGAGATSIATAADNGAVDSCTMDWDYTDIAHPAPRPSEHSFAPANAPLLPSATTALVPAGKSAPLRFAEGRPFAIIIPSGGAAQDAPSQQTTATRPHSVHTPLALLLPLPPFSAQADKSSEEGWVTSVEAGTQSREPQPTLPIRSSRWGGSIDPSPPPCPPLPSPQYSSNELYRPLGNPPAPSASSALHRPLGATPAMSAALHRPLGGVPPTSTSSELHRPLGNVPSVFTSSSSDLHRPLGTAPTLSMLSDLHRPLGTAPTLSTSSELHRPLGTLPPAPALSEIHRPLGSSASAVPNSSELHRPLGTAPLHASADSRPSLPRYAEQARPVAAALIRPLAAPGPPADARDPWRRRPSPPPGASGASVASGASHPERPPSLPPPPPSVRALSDEGGGDRPPRPWWRPRNAAEAALMSTVDVAREYGVTGNELACRLFALAERDENVTREMRRAVGGSGGDASQPFSQANVVALALRLAGDGAPLSHWVRGHEAEGGVFKLEAYTAVSRGRIEHARCRAYTAYGVCFRGSHCLFGHVVPASRHRGAGDGTRGEKHEPPSHVV